MNNKNRFDEIHIVKREDGKGYSLKGKGVINDEPCSVEVPFMKELNMIFDSNCTNYFRSANLSIESALIPENDIFYTVTVEPEFYRKKKLAKLESELKETRDEYEESIAKIRAKIKELNETNK